MVEWFKTHVFIAAWASPIIALVGLLLKRRAENSDLNWSKVIIYVAFLTAIAVVVTLGIAPQVRTTFEALMFLGFGYLIVDSGWRRR
jgi:hypothetical protein